MRHIDDGVLHAYLDGALHALAAAGALPDGAAAADVEAHFHSCADCRSRLEAERDIRGRAAAVLDDARPAAIDIPPFELVDARADTQTRRRSALPYAWAASVLLALGAGWVGGELLRRDAGFEAAQSTRADGLERSASASPAAPAQQSAATDHAATAPTAAAAAGAATAERDAAPAERAAAPAERSAEVPESRVAAGPGARDAADAAAAESVAAPMERVVAAPGVVARRETAPAAGDRMATQSRQVVAGAEQLAAKPLGQPLGGTDTTAGRAAAMRLAAAAESRLTAAPLPTAPVAPLPTAPVAPPLPPPAAPAAVASASALSALVPGAASALVGINVPQIFREHVARSRAGTLTWLPLSADDQRRSGTPLLRVEDGGLPVVESAIAGPGALLRVRQRLATGEEVELLLWRAPAIALDEVVVVGTPLRAAPVRGRQAASEPTRPVRHEVSVTALAGGVQEIILHELASGTWIALSGAVPLPRLREAASRLVAQP